jgi:hypothetical protein
VLMDNRKWKMENRKWALRGKLIVKKENGK